MSELFNSVGFTVLRHNGKFKGFVEPNGDSVSLETFNGIYFTPDNPPQMMDTLRKWNVLHPDKSLAITGYNTIERGNNLIQNEIKNNINKSSNIVYSDRPSDTRKSNQRETDTSLNQENFVTSLSGEMINKSDFNHNNTAAKI